MAAPLDRPRLNPWAAAGLGLWQLPILFVWLLDVGVSWGSYPSTSWVLVWALASIPAMGELVLAYAFERWLPRTASRRPVPTVGPLRGLALAVGALGYVTLFVASVAIAVVVFLQSRGLLNPAGPLPLWLFAVLFGLLAGTCFLLGSLLPSTDRSVPDYEPYQDGSPPLRPEG